MKSLKKHVFYAIITIMTVAALTARPDYIASYKDNTDEIRQLNYQEVDTSARADIREMSDDTVYLYLPSISTEVRRFVGNNRSELARFDRLILDLRGNYGGQLAQTYLIADMFLSEGDVIGLESGPVSFLNREITARGVRDFEFDSIIILQDAGTASAAESLILALAANLDNVTLVGETTFGKGTAQIALPMREGRSTNVSVLTLGGPNGENINHIGIKADIEHINDSTIIDFALNLRTHIQ